MSPLIVGTILFFVMIPFWVVSTSNRFTRLDKLIQEASANIDVALKRRHDLIPNLVETVKAYAAHERELLEELISAREKAMEGCGPEETELSRTVNTVLVKAEQYPDLKASQNFIELQHELCNSEDRIAAARRFYNANVRDFNLLLSSFPANLMAGDRSPKEFFEADPR